MKAEGRFLLICGNPWKADFRLLTYSTAEECSGLDFAFGFSFLEEFSCAAAHHDG
jgi:hypothetical protein